MVLDGMSKVQFLFYNLYFFYNLSLYLSEYDMHIEPKSCASLGWDDIELVCINEMAWNYISVGDQARRGKLRDG